MDTRRREGRGRGSSSVLLTKNWPRRVITWFRGSPKVTTGSYPFSSLRKGREQHVPNSSNHSLYPMKWLCSSYPEGNVGGNQQCDSPLSPSFSNDLHVSSASRRCPSQTLFTITHIYRHTYTHRYIIHTDAHIHTYPCTFVNINTCSHESSRTPQHSKWNCVGANRPQHMQMYSHIACD